MNTRAIASAAVFATLILLALVGVRVQTPPQTTTVDDVAYRVPVLENRVMKVEREIAALETQLQQLQANFAKHTRDYTLPLMNLASYDSFLRHPEDSGMS